ncbi:MAG: DUF2442 domain-containing protein [Actinobacteria bacterium]|nr:DUF2442 domain-containing protein [Actinomycetota bacterium]
MSDLVRVASVEFLGARVLRVEFSDGLVRELDFAAALPGIFSTIDNDELFGQALVDETARTVAWPNGLDLDPEVLHGDVAPASGVAPRVVREFHLSRTT